MNILPKKNWHVRKKENIARVRRDEAEAAEKEKEIEKRAKLAEQEARVAFLRNRARQNCIENIPAPDVSSSNSKQTDDKIEADIFTASGNINFFKEAEAGKSRTGTNEEYEEEKKMEKEAYEKKIGLLTYLGQDTLEATGQTAWFAERDHIVGRKKNGVTEEDVQEIGLKSKGKLDPLNEIMKHTNTQIYHNVGGSTMELPPSSEQIGKIKSKNLCRKDKKHKKERKRKKKRARDSNSDSEPEGKRRKKKHTSKKRKKRKRMIKCSSESENEEDKQEKLAKLREERLAREARERKREERLLAGKDPNAEEVIRPDLPYKQKYNSQFNPHLAKQNQDRVTPLSSLRPG